MSTGFLCKFAIIDKVVGKSVVGTRVVVVTLPTGEVALKDGNTVTVDVTLLSVFSSVAFVEFAFADTSGNKRRTVKTNGVKAMALKAKVEKNIKNMYMHRHI